MVYISSPPHSLLVAGVSACWCIGGSRCMGLGALVCTDSLPVAACWGLGLCLGSNVPRGLESLGPWLLWRRRLPVGPVGSSMQLPGASALWLLVVHLGLSSVWQ
ncbi:hypothetical protein AMECASPLE_025528 [Ameca splendens]|uniref:Secreted protein n=1 Tax=Ameca splendens TaxID=208324 RepID=A0ABV0YFU8_9TELE